MKNISNFRKIIIASVLLLAVFTILVPAHSAFAADPQPPKLSGSTGGIVPCTDNCNFNSLYQLINNFIKWAAYISFAIGVIAFAYAGYIYITAQGNVGKLKEAHEWFQNIFMGLLFVLGAVLIVSTIMRVLLKPSVYDNKNVGGRIDITNSSGGL